MLTSNLNIPSLKLRAPGQSINIAIHRYFWERSTLWQKIHEEERQAEEEDAQLAIPVRTKDKGKGKAKDIKGKGKGKEVADDEPASPAFDKDATLDDADPDDPDAEGSLEIDPDLENPNPDEEDDPADNEEATKEAEVLHFSPIDARFLSSRPLVRARVRKLLRNSPNYLHAFVNLLVAIVGFSLLFLMPRLDADTSCVAVCR